MQCLTCATVAPAATFAKKAPRAARRAPLVVRAEAETAAPAEPKPWAPPALNPSTPSPIFGGSTGETRWYRAGAIVGGMGAGWPRCRSVGRLI